MSGYNARLITVHWGFYKWQPGRVAGVIRAVEAQLEAQAEEAEEADTEAEQSKEQFGGTQLD